MQAIFQPMRRLTQNVRLTPFDTSTPEGRAKERVRRAAITSLTAALAKMVSLGTPLISIPIMLHYLGQEIYGLWMTTSSFVGMFLFADLGLGNGLITSFSRATGRGDLKAQQELVSSAAFMLACIALALGLVFYSVCPFLPWAAILNAKSATVSAEATGVVVALSLPFLLNIPLNIVQRTQMAMQEGYQSNLWQCLGSFCSLAIMFLGVNAQLSPAWLLFAVTVVPVFITCLNWWYFFYRSYPLLKPKFKCFSIIQGRALLQIGLGFFLVSLLSTIGMYADNIIVAHIQDLKNVAVYSIASRIMLILVAIVNLTCAPMWSANGEALARGDLAWVRSNTKKLALLAGVGTGLIGLFLIVFGPMITRIWLGPDFEISRFLLFAMGAGVVTASCAAPYFMVLNAAGIIYSQVKLFLIFTPLVIVAKLAMGHVYGPSGIALAGFFCYLIILLPGSVFLSKRALKSDSIKVNIKV